jgi:Outer membrane protein beta-barrel domain
MRKPWRPLALAVVLSVIVGVGVASAQTVVVRQAPPGSTVEFVLNSATVGSGTVNPDGDAIVPAAKGAAVSKPQMDAFIHVDVCGNVRRVIVVERGQVPNPKEPDCERTQVLGLFLIKPVSSLVVNVGGANPTVLLRQGSFSLTPPRTWRPPTGLIVFGGGSLTKFSNTTLQACGNASPCSRDDAGFGFTAGAAFWFTPYTAAEGAYLRPSKPTASGSGTAYSFDSDLDAHVVTLVGKVGGPAGPVRLFGQVGATYHRAQFGTTQTMEQTTVTIDGVEQTVPGGTQTYEIETDGWAWTFGGGLEIWVQPSFAIYAEAGRIKMKGEPINDADGTMDEWITTLFVGAKIHIGRNRN